jgi:hypothetical protein
VTARIEPEVVDRILAVGVLVVTVVQAAAWDASAWYRWSAVVEGVLLAGGLAVRPR